MQTMSSSLHLYFLTHRTNSSSEDGAVASFCDCDADPPEAAGAFSDFSADAMARNGMAKSPRLRQTFFNNIFVLFVYGLTGSVW